MKRLKLLCISAAVATTLFSSTVFASDVQPTQNSLDIDTAINMAIENSYKIKSLDIGIQQAQNKYNDALRSAADYNKKIPYVTGDQKLGLIKLRDFTQLESKYAVFKYTNIKEAAKNELKLGVYQLYSGLITAKEGLELEQKNFNNVEQQYKKAQLQLSLGQVSPGDAKSSEAAYMAEKAKLNQLQRQYDSLTKQLNQLLGVDINTKYTSFTKDNLATQAYPKTYNDYVKDALTNRVKIRNDNENINVKKLEFESVRAEFPYSTSPQYQIAKFPMEDAKNELETHKIDISIEINGLYNDLQNKIKSLEPEQKRYDSAKRTYEKALQSYNLGLISKIDFDKAETGLKYEELQLKSIQRNIWLAQTKLDYASNLGADASKLMPQGSSN